MQCVWFPVLPCGHHCVAPDPSPRSTSPIYPSFLPPRSPLASCIPPRSPPASCIPPRSPPASCIPHPVPPCLLYTPPVPPYLCTHQRHQTGRYIPPRPLLPLQVGVCPPSLPLCSGPPPPWHLLGPLLRGSRGQLHAAQRKLPLLGILRYVTT